MYDWAAQASAKPSRKTVRESSCNRPWRWLHQEASRLSTPAPLTPTSCTLAKIDPSTIRNLGHFSAANMAVSTHRYDDLIATKLAGSSRRERRQAGYQCPGPPVTANAMMDDFSFSSQRMLVAFSMFT